MISDGDVSRWCEDWKHQYSGVALAVVRPGNTAQVAEVLSLCDIFGVAVVPQGGNTGMVAGAIPDGSGEQIVLDLTRLSKIRKIDSINMAVHVDAGVTLHQLRVAVEEKGLMFPLSMGSEGSCTIGGIVATNAGGTQVLRYGTTRDLTLGVECVFADGSIWDGMRSLRKDNTGYNLRDLMIGSEGTLAVITGAVFKLYPGNLQRHAALVRIRTLENAVTFFELVRKKHCDELTAFEIMNSHSLSLVKQYLLDIQMPFLPDAGEWTVLIELSFGMDTKVGDESLQSVLELALEDSCIEDAVPASNLKQISEFWKIREGVALAQVHEGPNIKNDISLPIGNVPAFVIDAAHELREIDSGIRFVVFGHLGDGNLHYNVQAPLGVNAKDYVVENASRITSRVNELVRKFDGSISAEHGIGATKVEELSKYKGAVALDIMCRIRNALDPRSTLNPGKLIS